MRYLIFTDREPIRHFFLASGYEKLEFHPPENLRDICRGIRGAVVYLDLESRPFEEDLDHHLSYLKHRPDLRFAIVDNHSPAEDPAFFFHYGAVDYISPIMLEQGMSRERLEQVQRLNPIDRRYINTSYDKSVPYSGVNWDQVEEGREYIFAMLYVGLDDMMRVQEILGQEGAERFNREFRTWLDEHMDAWYGYQWLWNGWGGVYLFPFDGQNMFAMEAAMECYLNRRISRFSKYEVRTTFRMGLHLGATEFRHRGHTGNIVSDSLNTLFHMSCRENSRDEMVLSEEVRSHVPPSLYPYLERGEKFEGRFIYRIKNCL
ncbi:MAG: hypothetical protein JXA95_10405 [Spirochaetales bacterium]|nr:hypothetical protein [Spirochaetales bacterium]